LPAELRQPYQALGIAGDFVEWSVMTADVAD
jgi:hypothetical protein